MATVVYGTIGSVNIQKDPQSKRKKRYGLSYPITANLNGGYFSKSSGKMLVEGMLHQLLSTQKGERVMLPNFGTSLRSFLFQPIDEITFTAIKDDIRDAIKRYVPGVKILRLRVFPKDSLNIDGTQAIIIQLIVQITSLDNEILDTKVEIG